MGPQEIRESVMAFQKSRIILTAFQLDIFTYLGEGSHDAESISEALKLNKNATERLLNALVALGLLNKHDEQFSNAGDSLRYLSGNSPDYMAGLMHSEHLWNTWSHLTDVVKTGEPAHEEEINERGDEWLGAFIHAMHDRGKKQAPAQISKIDLEGVESVLDVGGGSGVFCMAFLDRKPELKTAIFDLPNVIPVSKEIVQKEGFSDKIAYYEGDFTRDELPRGFDLVFLSAIIHSNSFQTNQELIWKCYNALNPGGKVVVQDWIMDDSKTQPEQGAIFSINMLVGVEGGDCYSESEVKTWLTRAGFSDMEIIGIDSGLSQAIAIKK
ncbi:MAG: methyltransferase [Marinilabilia sp.]